MPSQVKNAATTNKNPSGDVCVFGDSHLGAVKLALDQGLIDLGGRKLTFWGADGPSFRGLRWRNGRIVPDPKVQAIVDKINGGSHATLGPDDFELFIFYGARLRAHEFFASSLRFQQQPDTHISAAAEQAILARWTGKTRAWRLATSFAEQGAQVMFVPTAFPSQGVLDKAEEAARYAVPSTKATRATLWEMLSDAATKAGFSIVTQADHTITNKTLTKAQFSVAGASESDDYVHKSPQFAALMIEKALAQAENHRAIAAE